MNVDLKWLKLPTLNEKFKGLFLIPGIFGDLKKSLFEILNIDLVLKSFRKARELTYGSFLGILVFFILKMRKKLKNYP